jgi:hypothetical protein
MSRRKAAADAPEKKRPRRRKTTFGQRIGLAAVRFVLPAILVAGAVALLVVFVAGQSAEAPELRAAIVDQLGLTDPNPAFAQTATDILEKAGYTVDYYPQEQVNVDFYRQLPEHSYTLIVFRVHIARFTEEGLTMTDPVRRQQVLDAFGNDVFLFTSEQYDRAKYPDELEKYRLFSVRNLAGSGDARFFGITPQFIDSSMQGKFNKTTIILMGCDGLLFDGTAKAFLKKGATTVVGWDNLVSASHTDAAVESLLPKLVSEKLTFATAIKRTMTEIGNDPGYDNTLKVYPSEAENRTLLQSTD